MPILKQDQNYYEKVGRTRGEKTVKVILASNSPRRKEILGQAGIQFEVKPSHKEEVMTKTNPDEVVKELSLQKAADVAESINEEAVIIGSDTIVAIGQHILGKPKTEEEAVQMITMLQGNSHQVYTGVSVVIKTKNEQGSLDCETIQFADRTNVNVNTMTEDEIRNYVATGEPMDKAGAYGIQGKFAVYIKGIEGDYYNVMGFPIARFYQEMKQRGVSLI